MQVGKNIVIFESLWRRNSLCIIGGSVLVVKNSNKISRVKKIDISPQILKIDM